MAITLFGLNYTNQTNILLNACNTYCSMFLCLFCTYCNEDIEKGFIKSHFWLLYLWLIFINNILIEKWSQWFTRGQILYYIEVASDLFCLFSSCDIFQMFSKRTLFIVWDQQLIVLKLIFSFTKYYFKEVDYTSSFVLWYVPALKSLCHFNFYSFFSMPVRYSVVINSSMCVNLFLRFSIGNIRWGAL